MRAVCAAAAVLCVVAEAAAAAPDHKWYSSAPVLPALVASSEHIAHPRCYNHSRLFLRALDNYTLWAVQMLDASVKVPDGVVDGSVTQLGHFDECLRVSVDDLRGQYCLVEVSFRPASYTPTQVVDPYTLLFDPKLHVWEKLKESEDRTKVTRSTLRLGLCMPSSCTPDQLQETLEHELRLLGEKEGLIFKARVSPTMCTYEQEPSPWTAGEITYSFTIALLIFLVAISSCYIHKHKNYRDGTVAEQVISCFSIQRNVKGLLNVTQQHPGLDSIDFYRLFFMACIVMGHRILIFRNPLPVSDENQHEHIFQSMFASILVNGELIVDFYFLSSGILLTHGLLTFLKGNKSANLLIIVVFRLVRLVPVYFMVVLFYATVFYRMGSGPFWNSVLGVERERCQDNWWTNFLFINNYVNGARLCMFQSWYLAVDTQLFIFCLLMVYVIARWPFWGYTLLALSSTLAVLTPFINTWWKKEDAIFLAIPEAMADVSGFKNFHDMYIKTENRAAPYIIGVIVGIILVKYRDSKFRINRVPVLFGFAVLNVVAVVSTMAAFPLYRPGSSSSHVEAGLYASLSRVFFGSSVGGIVLLASFDSSELLANIARWKPFRVLSKLTYGVYLVHMIGQIYNIGTMRVPIQTGAFYGLWMVMADVMFSFGLAFLLMLLLESPVRNLAKLVLKRLSRPTSSEQPQIAQPA